jgi:peptidoglycan/LPS O-acetylase OafA/YrhL
MTTVNSERDYAIDWLRVCAMLTVFLFHCGRFFDHEDWHVKNNELDFGMNFLSDA